MITKEKIIHKSAELFNTYGYHACSLSHIMEATGLQKGGIYNHFKNKDEIAIAAFNYSYNLVINRFKEMLEKAITPTEKLLAIIDVFVSFVDKPIVNGGGCPIFNTAMDATNTHPQLKEKAKAGIKGLKKYVEIKLKEGIAAREIRSDINTSKVATLLVATLEGAIIVSRVENDRECLTYASDYVKQYLYKNLLINKPVNSVG